MVFLLRALFLSSVFLNCLNLAACEICDKAVCEYNFEIGHRRTMTYNKGFANTFTAMFNGSNVILEQDRYRRPLPTTDDVSDEVITADGVRRNILTVNGEYPGPPIEVMEGAQVVVHVKNRLFTQSVTIHWHGIHMKKTPWMDGAAHISQCPILPRQSFTYRFIAYPAGTHWYHDHLMGQRSDGLAGMFIIHKSKPTLPEVSLMVSDWFHYDSVTAEITNFFNPHGAAGDNMIPIPVRDFSHDLVELSPYPFVSGLINGRGRYNDNPLPLWRTNVHPGQTTLFRVVNSGAEFHFEVSVDQHKLQVVALDGQHIEAITVDSFIIGLGERVDFLLTANEIHGNYWLRCKTLKRGNSLKLMDDGKEQVILGIIRYEGAVDEDPSTSPRTCSPADKCLTFNCPFKGYPDADNKKCVQPNEAKSTFSQVELEQNYGLKDDDYDEFILNFGFTFISSINSIMFELPDLPFSDNHYKKGVTSCEAEQCENINDGCKCTHTIEVPYNKTIQMVFVNYQPVPEGEFTVYAHHSIHLHGHNFAVVKTGFPSYNTTTGLVTEGNDDIICDTAICRKPRWNGPVPALNLDHPQLKDTVIVPAQGYIVLRFRSNNPGHWLLHCHTESHANLGMQLVLSEAVEYIPKPPEGFPVCSFFEWSESQFSGYVDQPMKDTRNIQADTTSESGGSLGGNTVPACTSDESDESLKLSKQELIGLIIGCVALGAVLTFIPFVMLLCTKSKSSSINMK